MADANVSFMSSLCAGRVEEDLLVPYPSMDTEEAGVMSLFGTPLLIAGGEFVVISPR